jgi:hypothetical protein
MDNEGPLFLVDYASKEVTPLKRVRDLEKIALEVGSFVTVVKNPRQNELAVSAQKELKTYLSNVEKARKEIKRPIIDLGKKVEEIADQLVSKVQAEFNRVSSLVNAYQMVERARIAKEEEARLEAMRKAEEERQKAVDIATTTAEREEINATFARQTSLIPAVQPATKVEGQIVKEEWDFEVVDPFMLIKMHPNFVRISALKDCFDRLAIKDALKTGFTVYGIKAWKQTNSTVKL